MTISFLGTGSKPVGTTPLIAGVPIPLAKGDLCLIGRCTYFATTDDALGEPGWVREIESFGGTGSAAADHTSTITVDRRQITGTEQASGAFLGAALVVLDQSLGANGGAIAQAITYRKTGASWDIESRGGSDSTHGANRSAIASVPMSLAPGDVLVMFVAFDTEPLHTITAETLTAAGITFSAISRRSYTAGTTTGHDGNMGIWEATVTAGTATVAPTFAFTTATSQCGPVAFVRLREIPPIVSGWRPSTGDLLNLTGVPRRFDDFRFELVDRRNHPLGELHPDLGRRPTVNWDTTRPIHRSFDNFHLTADQEDDVNKLTDRVRVWMRLQNGVEYSLGVFLWADANETRRPWGFESEGTLLDKTYILDQPTITPLSLPRTTTPLVWYFEHVTSIPEFNVDYQIEPDFRDDFVSGVIFYMLVTMGEEGASKELGSPVNWQGGATHLTIGNDVMRLVAYLPVHCDRDGVLKLMRARPIETVPPDLEYDIGKRMVENSIVRSDDLLSAPNYVVVVDGAANQTPIRGVWRAPASAPYSEANRKYAIGRYLTLSGLSTQAEADIEAQRQGEYLLKAGSWIEWQSPADPRHDAYNILSVLGNKMLEVKWQIVCIAGQPMSHRALRVYPPDGVQ